MKTLAAVVLLLLASFPCVAQEGLTSQLTGRVSSSGQLLSGVEVTLTSPHLQGSRTTSTGANGGFLFALLPPAEYHLHFDRRGFAPVDAQVRVALVETARLNIEMVTAAVQETITVEPSFRAGAADPSIRMQVAGNDLRTLPGTEDIPAAVLLSPSADIVRSRLAVAGAPTWDSLFLIDGVVVNENLTGQPHDLFIEDAIEQVAVITGGIGAEYGRMTGGVVSTLTKSGGNELHGSIRDTLTNNAWTHRTRWRDEPRRFGQIDHATEGTLGGFLVKDRLWYFVAARAAAASASRFTALTNVQYRTASHDTRWEGKVTDHLTSHQTVVLSYLHSSLRQTNVDNGALDIASLIARRAQPSQLAALAYETVLGSNTFGEVHFGQKKYAFERNGGLSQDRIDGTYINVRALHASLNAPAGCGICGSDDRNNQSWSGKLSHYVNTRWGNHTTVIGAERFHEERRNSGNRSSSYFDIQDGSAQILNGIAYPHFDASTSIIWTPPLAVVQPSREITTSLHASDLWDVTNRLGVEFGLRYDRNDARNTLGDIVANDSSYSPRLNVSFDLMNDGSQHLLFSAGRYTSKIFEDGGSPQQLGTFNQFGWRYRGPEINADGTPPDHLLAPRGALAALFAWFDSVGGVGNRQYLSFFSDPLSAGEFMRPLKSPSVDALSAGYSLHWRTGWLRADWVSRTWHHFYAARVDTTTGQELTPLGLSDVAWVVNDDRGTARRYRAVDFQAAWTLHGLTINTAYTWSTLRGNDEGDEMITVSAPRNLPLQLWYPEFLAYPNRRPQGYLTGDQRHRARLWIRRDVAMPHGSFTASLLQWFDSGRAYSAEGDIDATGRVTPYSGVPANPGYALNQVTNAPYFFRARGAFRTDRFLSTDGRLTYEIPLRDARLFVNADVMNALNNGAIIAPGTDVMTRFRYGASSGLVAFNPFTDVPVEGINYRFSSTFGRATGPESYQTPRTFQVAIGAKF